MRVLVACEYSGRVREAFRARGHDAWSCDLLPAEDGSKHHFQGDVMLIAEYGLQAKGEYFPIPWDLMIAHPPCTHLAVSGARHFDAKRLDGRQQEAIEFFLALARGSIRALPSKTRFASCPACGASLIRPSNRGCLGMGKPKRLASGSRVFRT